MSLQEHTKQKISKSYSAKELANLKIDEKDEVKIIPKFYRAKQLGKHLGVGTSTIWKWCKEKKIKAYRLSGGVTVFNIEDVERDLLVEVSYE